MSFDNLKLPGSAVVALYGQSLVDLSDLAPSTVTHQPSAPAMAEPDGYTYLGGNAKKLCLVIRGAEQKAVFDRQLEFLVKMMGACKMTLNDIAIVDHSKKAVSIKELKEQLAPAQMLLFGVSSLEVGLPINFPLYKTQPYDGTSYLAASPLDALAQDTEEGKLLKSKLWVCLRQLFGV